MSKKPTIALIGNPNSGKTAVFNQLTGLAQKVSNYPGVTVEKHVGKIRISEKDYNVTDYPGIYGIVPNSLDEKIVCEEILNWCTKKESSPDLIVCVLDANNISRNLYLATQILEIGIPTIFALNMIDLFLSFATERIREECHEVEVLELTTAMGCSQSKSNSVQEPSPSRGQEQRRDEA